MKTSDKGLVAIARHEGIVVAPYRDSVGVMTWGVGHTSGAGLPNPADMPQAMPLTPDAFNDAVGAALLQFAKDLAKYEARVNDAVKVPLKQHEFDALVSFDVNTGGIYKANLTKSLNSGNKAAAARGFMGWLKPVEIRGRRTAEMNLFETGDYGSGPVPIWGTNGAGRLTKVVKTLSPDALLRMMRPIQEPQIVAEASQHRESRWDSKTLRAQVAQWFATTGASAFAIFNTADEQTRWIIAGLAGLALIAGVVVFRERLQKWAAGIR